MTSKLNIKVEKKLVRCMFGALLYLVQRPDTKKIRAEVFGELRNVVQEENGEDIMVRESN